jgi:hypothetical protein
MPGGRLKGSQMEKLPALTHELATARKSPALPF